MIAPIGIPFAMVFPYITKSGFILTNLCAPLEFNLKPDVISSNINTLYSCFVIDLSLEINFLFGYPSLHGSITTAAVFLYFF